MNDTLKTLRRDHEALASSVNLISSEMVKQRESLDAISRGIDVDRAVRLVQERNLDQRLERIEASVKGVYGLGKWVLGTVASGLLLAIVTFIVNGGLSSM